MDIPSELTLATISEPLRFSAEGEWFHGTERVTHHKVEAFFSSRLRFYELLSGYGVEALGKIVPVTVEDTPRVARDFRFEGPQLFAILNDGTELELDRRSFGVTSNNVLYLIGNTWGRIRVTRGGAQGLYPLISESGPGFVIRNGAIEWPVLELIE